MRYLLDTHTALWALDERKKLSPSVLSLMDDVSVPLCISVVSAWEIAIKTSVGKLDFVGGSDFFLEMMQRNGVEILQLKSSHIRHVETMPFHHRDPFDRMLISIALAEELTLLTADENIQQYDVPWIW